MLIIHSYEFSTKMLMKFHKCIGFYLKCIGIFSSYLEKIWVHILDTYFKLNRFILMHEKKFYTFCNKKKVIGFLFLLKYIAGKPI